MSELINTNDNRATIRWKLLASVSAVALTASIVSASAEGSANPQLWIELGGQLSRLEDGVAPFAPQLSVPRPTDFFPARKFETPPYYSVDETGKLTFRPDASDWSFSASVRYGHSAGKKDISQQTYGQPSNVIYYTVPGSAPKKFIQHLPAGGRFADTTTRSGEHYLILDFQAGKDVGIGMFGGKNGSSVVDLGIRFAQFSSSSNFALKSRPDWHRSYKYINYPPVINKQHLVLGSPYHSNSANLHAARTFHGIGPSISWNASAPFAGNPQDGEVVFDWGVNAALLFGRQRAKVHHQTSVQYHGLKYAPGSRVVVGIPINTNHTRSRSVTVPNIGGFAGLSFRIQNFKMSAGYRADFFFNAIDGGIDTAKNENRGFYGPYASISIGLGD